MLKVIKTWCGLQTHQLRSLFSGAGAHRIVSVTHTRTVRVANTDLFEVPTKILWIGCSCGRGPAYLNPTATPDEIEIVRVVRRKAARRN